MSQTILEKPFAGIIPPMITPLLNADTLDVEGTERLIEHILGGEVHGLFILGTTGEAPSLSYKLRSELIERTCKQVANRVPVLVGITDTAFAESVNLAKKAADLGADAVVLAPPYYFPAGQPELVEYIQHLCDKLPLPLFLYNMPGCTKVSVDPATVVQLADNPKILGLKDSSGNMTYFHTVQTLLKSRDDFTMLVGPEELLAEAVLLGAHGGVCGGANLFPKLYVDLYEAAAKGDLTQVRHLHEKVMEISTTIYSVGKFASGFLKGVKCSLSLMGICDDFLSEPFHRFRDSERQKIKAAMEKLEISLD